jgi:hypothetical protein
VADAWRKFDQDRNFVLVNEGMKKLWEEWSKPPLGESPQITFGAMRAPTGNHHHPFALQRVLFAQRKTTPRIGSVPDASCPA